MSLLKKLGQLEYSPFKWPVFIMCPLMLLERFLAVKLTAAGVLGTVEEHLGDGKNININCVSIRRLAV